MAQPMIICGIFLACVFISSDAQGNNLNISCYHCNDDQDARQGPVSDPRNCRHIKVCAADEVCRVTTKGIGGQMTYGFGCHKLLQCQILTVVTLQHNYHINTGIDLSHLIQTGEIVGRKRQITQCDVCCGDNLCNDDECQTVINRIAKFAREHHFNYTTLQLIKPS